MQALPGVDLEIADGEWLAIQGPTGHGKTTLLQMLGGLDRPTSGVIDFDGTGPGPAAGEPGHPGPGRVDRLHLPDLQPDPHAQRPGERRGRPGARSACTARRAARARPGPRWRAWAWATGCGTCPSELSGGQQQRVAIARALVKQPKVLLADEPTGNLDEGTRDEIIALLDSSGGRRGLTMVLVTHDSAVARRAQRIGVMQKRQAVHQPGHPAPRRAGTAPAAPAERRRLSPPRRRSDPETSRWRHAEGGQRDLRAWLDVRDIVSRDGSAGEPDVMDTMRASAAVRGSAGSYRGRRGPRAWPTCMARPPARSPCRCGCSRARSRPSTWPSRACGSGCTAPCCARPAAPASWPSSSTRTPWSRCGPTCTCPRECAGPGRSGTRACGEAAAVAAA